MQYNVGKKGFIEVITGPMFAGKTEELIRRVKRMEYAHRIMLSSSQLLIIDIQSLKL